MSEDLNDLLKFFRNLNLCLYKNSGNFKLFHFIQKIAHYQTITDIIIESNLEDKRHYEPRPQHVEWDAEQVLLWCIGGWCGVAESDRGWCEVVEVG